MNPEINNLLTEREDNTAKIQQYELKKEQLDHQLVRAENKESFLSKKERDRRTHQLCNLGGTVEHFIPAAKDFTREEFYTLLEKLIALTEAQKLLAGLGGDELCLSASSGGCLKGCQ